MVEFFQVSPFFALATLFVVKAFVFRSCFSQCPSWLNSTFLHRKTDSGLKPRPLGRCEGWNPGLEGRGFDRSYLGGVQT
ncbi:MAG: hypothetical protein LBI87_08795, partial [Candidatus Accumulibacter sp.]|nr:hypothetical protein [Accumulibacter sp.]